MDDELILKNRLKEARSEKKLSQNQLAEMVGCPETPSAPLRRDSLIQQQNWH